MARSRLELRKMAEAAEKAGGSPAAKKATKKRKATKRKTTTRAKRAKDAPVRKKLVWGIFSGSMKEEARFPYDQKEEAEAKLEQLRSKSKKPYFMQPIKEVLADAAGLPVDDAPPAIIDEEEPDLPDDEDAVVDDEDDDSGEEE